MRHHLMPPLRLTCTGCGSTFRGAAGELWCPKCLPTVKPFVVELSATQWRQVEALATIRGVTTAEILRLGIDSLAWRTKTKRLTPEQQAEAERLRPS